MGCVVRGALGTGAGGADLKSSATVPVVIILTVVGAGGGLSCPHRPHRPHCPHRPPRLTRTKHYARRICAEKATSMKFFRVLSGISLFNGLQYAISFSG
jgi:hypothetical protein